MFVKVLFAVSHTLFAVMLICCRRKHVVKKVREPETIVISLLVVPLAPFKINRQVTDVHWWPCDQ